jgi:hypothetical protein
MPDSDYSFTARLLHRIALGMPMISHASFDIERATVKPENLAAIRDERHVFVTGLARAGTTILLRASYEAGVFRSLTYRDMPFILMPNIWQKISKAFRKYEAEKERAHGDRIQVGFDSPEAFEEVFWRTFSGSDYIKSDHLRPHEVDSETVDYFIEFVSHVVASGGEHETRYLSKNNNNLLRMGTIRHAFPNAVILIPFRDPVQQANSLMKQHRHFKERHQKDRFACDYMRWLVHHEFGMAHKPFRFDVNETNQASAFQPGDINYWLNIWRNTYRFVLNSLPEGSLLVNYELLCEQPEVCLSKIFERAGIDLDPNNLGTQFQAAPSVNVEGVNKELASSAFDLYHSMREATVHQVL